MFPGEIPGRSRLVLLGRRAVGFLGHCDQSQPFLHRVTTGAPSASDSAAISRSCISGTSGNRSSLSSYARPNSDSSIPLTESSASSNADGSRGLPSLADR